MRPLPLFPAAPGEKSFRASPAPLMAGRIVACQNSVAASYTSVTQSTPWPDWFDYWRVDFDFESKREIIRVRKEVVDIFGNDTMTIVDVAMRGRAGPAK
jgi:hypothetical protein